MRRTMARALAWTTLMTSLAAGTAWADLGADIKKAMKQKSSGTWYLKTNTPYLQGRHAYGAFMRPLVIVTAKDGVKIEGSAEVQGSLFHAEGRRLVLRVNDAVKVDEFEWESDDSTLTVELEGTGRTGEGPGVVRFAELKSLDDFETCWKETFSDVSIEQKYDWPDEIKKAVVERRVLEGMTREQVLIAVGNPERVKHAKEAGKDLETWIVQQGEGAKMGFWTMKVGDKREMEIAFVNGKVTNIGGAEEQPAIKIK